MNVPDVSVIISTYNQPLWLEKVLWSYEFQTFKNFEVIIADDGSNNTTKILVDKIKREVSFPIQHIWHEDNGFQKTIILNKATVKSKGKYLVYTDGDCVARKDFLEVHVDKRDSGYFLSGGYFKLPLNISEIITKEDIEKQLCFDVNWLKIKGLKSSFKNNKIIARGIKQKILNTLTPTTRSWNGHNSSGYKSDIIKANGFDERMQYGGEDRELGERLLNSGLKVKQIRYYAICIHLDHERSYMNQDMIAKNQKIRTETREKKLKRTAFGIKKD